MGHFQLCFHRLKLTSGKCHDNFQAVVVDEAHCMTEWYVLYIYLTLSRLLKHTNIASLQHEHLSLFKWKSLDTETDICIWSTGLNPTLYTCTTLMKNLYNFAIEENKLPFEFGWFSLSTFQSCGTKCEKNVLWYF